METRIVRRTRAMHLARRALTGVALAGLLAQGVAGQGVTPPPPTAEDIRTQIAKGLHAYWSVTGLNTSEPVPGGDVLAPTMGWRFAATVEPTTPLYRAVEENPDGLTVLDPQAKGSDEVLYGVAEARFRGGKWTLGVTIENDAYVTRGKPRSFFAGETVIAGTPEEAAARERRAERERNALQAAHEIAMEAQRLEHERALAAIKASHDAALKDTEAELTRALQAEEQRINATLQAAEKRLLATVEAGKKRAETQQAELDQELAAQTARLARIKTVHETELAAAAEANAAEIAGQQAQFVAEAEERRTQLAQLAAASEEAQALATQATETAEAMRRLETAMAALSEAHANALAATTKVLEARSTTVTTLLEKAEGADKGNAYRNLLRSARDSGNIWLEEQAIRYGLGGTDQAVRRAAWLALATSEVKQSADGRALIASHLKAITEDRRLLEDVLDALQPQLAEDARLRTRVRETLLSARQWASEVMGYSAQRGTYNKATSALGAPDSNHCQGANTLWSSERTEDGSDWIHVRFDEAMMMPTVIVEERRSTGLVTAITLGNRDGSEQRYEVVSTEDNCMTSARFEFTEHVGPVREVTVEVTTRAYENWGIDAIGLEGTTLAGR